MTALPWVRFFPSDWLAGTRGLSAVESGVYITLIAMMYERGEPLPNDPARLARLCGASNSTFAKVIAALIEGGKIVIVGGGLWNDRVQKEQVYRTEKSEVGKQAAEKRWRKAEQNQRPADALAMPAQSEGNANQKPEPEKEEGSLREPRAREPDSILVEFEGVFWPAYPNKVGKPKALTSFRTERKSASLDEIMAGLARYVASKPADRQWLNPTTFLNQRRFNDQPAVVAATGPPRQRGPTFLEISQAARAYLRDAEPDDRQPPYLRLAQ